MKVDLSQDGWNMFFKKPWKQVAFRKVMDGRDWRSAEIYEYVNSVLDDSSISRASVIFFLDDLVEEDLLSYREETGKGGHHKVYTGTITLPEFLECVRCKANEKIDALLTEWNLLRTRETIVV